MNTNDAKPKIHYKVSSKVSLSPDPLISLLSQSWKRRELRISNPHFSPLSCSDWRLAASAPLLAQGCVATPPSSRRTLCATNSFYNICSPNVYSFIQLCCPFAFSTYAFSFLLQIFSLTFFLSRSQNATLLHHVDSLLRSRRLRPNRSRRPS
jgi:hypothetical protein